MKKIIVLVTMITVMAVSVFAQGVTGFASPQNSATQGRIRSFADDFIRPDAYQNVKVDDWFGFTSFASTTRAAVGWGTKLGEGSGPFLGLFYNGSVWYNVVNSTTTERDSVTYYTPQTLDGTQLPYNQIAVLLGLGDMGFRLSLRSTNNSINQSDFTDGATKYKSYEAGLGNITPQIAWSLTNNIIDGVGVRPWVTLDFGFNNDFSKSQRDGDNDVTINRSYNNIRPELQIGLGGIILAEKNKWRTSFDLEYLLGMDLYNNEYNDVNGKVVKISGRYVPDDPSTVVNERVLDEYFSMNHRIKPVISAQWNGDNLRLRAKFDLNVTLASTDTTPKFDDNGTLKTQGNVTNVFAIGFNPDLALAAQWQVTEKFFINMGGRLNLSAMTITTTNSEAFVGGTATANTKSTATAFTFGGGLSNALSLGVTLNATDNMFLEAACGITTGNVLTTFGALTTFSNLLVGLKF